MSSNTITSTPASFTDKVSSQTGTKEKSKLDNLDEAAAKGGGVLGSYSGRHL